jgi:hypothetical protein
MITGFLNIIYGIIYIITSPLRLLPDVVLNNGFSDAITNANGYISGLNAFVPIDTIITILGVFIAIEGAYMLFKLIMWVIKRLPTQS